MLCKILCMCKTCLGAASAAGPKIETWYSEHEGCNTCSDGAEVRARLSIVGETALLIGTVTVELVKRENIVEAGHEGIQEGV